MSREQDLVDSDRLSHRDEWHEPRRYERPVYSPGPGIRCAGCNFLLSFSELEGDCCQFCDDLDLDAVWARQDGWVEDEVETVKEAA